MKDVCFIAAAGDFHPMLLPSGREKNFWIAADAGYRKLLDAGVRADLFVGDGDSSACMPEGVERIELPVVKDDTDTVAAVRCGLDRGYRIFCLYGALGGERPSHTLANVQTLLFARRQGGRVLIADGRSLMLLLTAEDGTVVLPEETGFFSLFAADGPAAVTVRNAKYEGEKIRLTPEFPLGVSNERKDGCAVCADEGTVLLVCEPVPETLFATFSPVKTLLETLKKAETAEKTRKK
ncbi:MAG: thiamine diphosphokinase [Clostridia bacterium]|nr:thiamine diphosphokinase [Clostridia bacterium]